MHTRTYRTSGKDADPGAAGCTSMRGWKGEGGFLLTAVHAVVGVGGRMGKGKKGGIHGFGVRPRV